MIFVLLVAFCYSLPTLINPSEVVAVVQGRLGTVVNGQAATTESLISIPKQLGKQFIEQQDKVVRPITNQVQELTINFPNWAVTPTQKKLLQESVALMAENPEFWNTIRQESAKSDLTEGINPAQKYLDAIFANEKYKTAIKEGAWLKDLEANKQSARKKIAGSTLRESPPPTELELLMDTHTEAARSRITLQNKIMGRELTIREQRELEAVYYDQVIAEKSAFVVSSRQKQNQIFGRTLTFREEMEVYDAFTKIDMLPEKSKSHYSAQKRLLALFAKLAGRRLDTSEQIKLLDAFKEPLVYSTAIYNRSRLENELAGRELNPLEQEKLMDAFDREINAAQILKNNMPTQRF